MAAWIAALVLLHASCGTGLAREEPAAKAHHVVSYLVYAGQPPLPDVNMLPTEGLPSEDTFPGTWQWRLFDPATRRDTLLFTLQSFPTKIHWDPTFQNVEFVLGTRIERAPWRLGALPRLQATLPFDSSICDVWSDPAGGWHIVAQSEVPVPHKEGYTPTGPVASRWDMDRAGRWTKAVVDSPGGGHYGECYTSPLLQEGAPRVNVATMDSLLDLMRLGNHRDSTLQSESEWNLVWVASDLDASIGIETRAIFGDSYHAKEPMAWVNRALNKRETIYAEGQSREDGQIAFRERDGFLLVVAEYSGTYPAVIDMRTGKTLLKLDRPSARAVWVPAPK